MKHRDISKKDLQEIKNNFKVVATSNPIHIVAIAVDRHSDTNNEISVMCVTGTPINFKSVYDLTKDAFNIFCASHLDLGMVDISYAIIHNNEDMPSIPIPIPNNLIKKHFTEDGNASYSSWLSEYPEEKYDIKYLQILCSY